MQTLSGATMEGKISPWGKIQFSKKLADGIFKVSTASHGGVKLEKRQNSLIPKDIRRKGGWYEEDCEWALAALCFKDVFGKQNVEIAKSIAKNYFPVEYAMITGEKVRVEESRALRKIRFEKETYNKFVVRSAVGDWHPDVPSGMVKVYASRASDGSEKTAVIPKENYSIGEFGYVLEVTK